MQTLEIAPLLAGLGIAIVSGSLGWLGVLSFSTMSICVFIWGTIAR